MNVETIRQKSLVSLRAVAGISLLALGGCRFKMPTVAEQDYLMQKGAFPGGAPPWVVAGTAAARPGGGAGGFAGGLIPRVFSPSEKSNSAPPVLGAASAGGSAGGFTVPSVVQEQQQAEIERKQRIAGISSDASVNGAVNQFDSTREERGVNLGVSGTNAGRTGSGRVAGTSGNTAEDVRVSSAVQALPEHERAARQKMSPLDRIERVCPALEKQVVQALQITDLQQRLKTYENLVVQCPTSPDLWVWLGKDYARDRRPVKAGRCYQKALSLDPAHEEATKLLEENKKQVEGRSAFASPAASSDQQSEPAPNENVEFAPQIAPAETSSPDEAVRRGNGSENDEGK